MTELLCNWAFSNLHENIRSKYHNLNFSSLGTYTTSWIWNITKWLNMFIHQPKLFHSYSVTACYWKYYFIDTWQNYISDRMTGNTRPCNSRMPHTNPVSHHWKGVKRKKIWKHTERIFSPVCILVVSWQFEVKMSMLRYCVQGHVTVLLCAVPKIVPQEE